MLDTRLQYTSFFILPHFLVLNVFRLCETEPEVNKYLLVSLPLRSVFCFTKKFASSAHIPVSAPPRPHCIRRYNEAHFQNFLLPNMCRSISWSHNCFGNCWRLLCRFATLVNSLLQQDKYKHFSVTWNSYRILLTAIILCSVFYLCLSWPLL